MAKPPRLFTSEEKKREKNPSFPVIIVGVCLRILYFFRVITEHISEFVYVLFFLPRSQQAGHTIPPPDLISSSPPPHQRNPPPPPPSPIFLSNPPPPHLRSLPLPSSALPDGRRIGLRRRPQLSDHDGHLRRPPEHARHGC